MTINSDVDIPSALDKLGKKPEFLNISPPNPPHNIISWEGGDARPTDDEINAAWETWKKEEGHKRNRENAYPSVVEQLDLIYHSGVDAWKAKIKETKDKYPKA
tara:strand:- start:43 stop:351 length:309 start_codon:yes stop_codon:yes gene_type:complete